MVGKRKMFAFLVLIVFKTKRSRINVHAIILKRGIKKVRWEESNISPQYKRSIFSKAEQVEIS